MLFWKKVSVNITYTHSCTNKIFRLIPYTPPQEHNKHEDPYGNIHQFIVTPEPYMFPLNKIKDQVGRST